MYKVSVILLWHTSLGIVCFSGGSGVIAFQLVQLLWQHLDRPLAGVFSTLHHHLQCPRYYLLVVDFGQAEHQLCLVTAEILQ